MISISDLEKIMNFTRTVWRELFKEKNVAPISLVYDPNSAFTGILSGLCHVAHDYLCSENYDDYDPDGHIFVVDPSEEPCLCCLKNADLINIVEYLIIASYGNKEEVDYFVNKIPANGLLVVLNDIYVKPKKAKEIDCLGFPTYGISRTYRENIDEESIKPKLNNGVDGIRLYQIQH